MTGTCQVFDLATKLLVYGDGAAPRSRPIGPDQLRPYFVVRYVHRTLAPRGRMISFQLIDFLAYRIEKQPLDEVLGYLSSDEREFLRSGLLEEEFVDG
jgi:hypothetical protein